MYRSIPSIGFCLQIIEECQQQLHYGMEANIFEEYAYSGEENTSILRSSESGGAINYLPNSGFENFIEADKKPNLHIKQSGFELLH